MPRINILPLSLRNKIAAGEVVERPASVIKELVENSIDAGSTRIEIDAVRAGKKLIRVSDNGLGMERDDAMMAFERYATSKIREESDLFNLSTMGFRGEALSSIAAVSRMKLITAYQAGEHLSATVGTCIEIAGGEIKEVKDCPATGTSIEVKELFFNTPARRKFLKSDATENYHIIDTVTREALSHYRIGFVLRMDGDDVLTLPAASSQRERLLQIYGKEFVDGLLETGFEERQMGIRAYVSKATMLRNNRNNQYLFINQRPVKDQSVTYAVYKAYESLIPKDKHPLFFIFLKIDASRVDFNVHPAKREVRFEDKSGIFNFVQKVVKDALKQDTGFVMKEADFREPGLQRPGEMAHGGAGLSYAAITPDINTSGNLVSEKLEQFYSGSTPFLYLGDTLVAVAGSGGLTIIDYHAAHERINYERFLKRADTHSHPLLFPQQVKLHGGDYRVILDNLQALKELGLEIEDFGHGTLLVRSLPEALRDADLNALMNDIASALLNKGSGTGGGEPMDSVKKALAARMACHASIRGREVPDGLRIAELIKSLDAADNPHSCPHGRPTRIYIPMDELRKMFRK